MDKRFEDLKNFTRDYFLRYGGMTERMEYIIEKCQVIDDLLNRIPKAELCRYIDKALKRELLTEQEAAAAIYDRWTMIEWIHNCGMGKMKILKLLKLTSKSKKELENIKTLPDEITVYRGGDLPIYKGISWTNNREVAEWFAKRYETIYPNMTAFIYSGKIQKNKIVAYFTDRGEAEIVCDWKDVKDLKCEQIR